MNIMILERQMNWDFIVINVKMQLFDLVQIIKKQRIKK